MAILGPQLLAEGFSFVPLSRLGQNHIENIFCCFRGRNGFNDRRPECSAFRPALRATALCGMLQPVTTNNNFANDEDSLLTSILDRSSAASKAGGARSAAIAASAIVAGDYLGEERASEGDEVVGLDIEQDTEDVPSHSEEQVLDLV
jgi:hypothetical protein